MSLKETIEAKLSEAFIPSTLEIEDESWKHASHKQSPGGESHFSVLIVSDTFEGKSIVMRHKAVYETLKGELAGPLHALSLKTLTEKEFNSSIL